MSQKYQFRAMRNPNYDEAQFLSKKRDFEKLATSSLNLRCSVTDLKGIQTNYRISNLTYFTK